MSDDHMSSGADDAHTDEQTELRIGQGKPGPGRPKGRKNDATLAREAAEEQATQFADSHIDDALRTAVQIMQDVKCKPTERLRAVDTVLERSSLGRAKTHKVVDHNHSGMVGIEHILAELSEDES